MSQELFCIQIFLSSHGSDHSDCDLVATMRIHIQSWRIKTFQSNMLPLQKKTRGSDETLFDDMNTNEILIKHENVK